MNLNIFKRVSELESEVAALRNVLYQYTEMIREHIVRQQKSSISEEEKIANRKAYHRAWYQKNKAKKAFDAQITITRK